MKNLETSILLENISKYYRIGVKEQMHENLTIAILDFLRKPVKNFLKYRSLYKFSEQEILNSLGTDDVPSDIIWALKDISLDVKKGEVLGIIGSNGAGKSTLLKILSRITHPSIGVAKIFGNVSSLLEVGTGFHPDLTGRENVYLNGTILGMKKKEIDSKFDEIVAFSGVEKFIDTPVKRYSSGMMVRLAFSVAAHLEPELLIIDEVLAVGDAQFQKKCLGKMNDVAKEGRTVLFVSHNMTAINQLCTRVVLLKNGQIANDGKPEDVVSYYLTDGASQTATWRAPVGHSENDVKIESVSILSLNDEPVTLVNHDQDFKLKLNYCINKKLSHLIILCRITDAFGNIIFTSWDSDTPGFKHQTRTPGHYSSTCIILGSLLRPGTYLVSVGAFISYVKLYEFFENIMRFEIATIGYKLNVERQGILAPVFNWEVSQIHDPK